MNFRSEIPFGNFGLPFKKSRFPRTFSIWEDQFSLSIYIPTEISGFFFVNGKQPRCRPRRVIKQNTRMRYPFQTPGRVASFRNERTVGPRLHDIGTRFRTRVKISLGYRYRGELTPIRYEILCWYHVNEYRAIRRNRSELVSE